LWNDAATPGTKGVGPQICNISSLQGSFRDEVLRTTWAWTTLARRNQQIKSSEEALSDYGDGGQSEEGNQYDNDLMLPQIKTQLLPLLLKEEVLEINFWMTVDSA
jgi:hypothetical protein